MKRDFAQLYSQLGLRPDCTLEEFKRAYRRRIAALHPDKGRQLDTPENHALLPDLIKLYATATRFHRRHGRLPGAHPARSLTGRSAAADATGRAPASTDPELLPSGATSSPNADGTDTDPQNRRTPLGLALLLLALAIALAWNLPLPRTELAGFDPTVAESPVAAIATHAEMLQLGMDKATVLAIQGEPLGVAGDDWDYGPSWVRFERGRLVDWHSSQLAPLKTDTAEPRLAVDEVVTARR